MASGAEDRDALAPEGAAQSTLTTQQLRHRQPYAADDEVALPEEGENADASKPKKSHGRHRTTAPDDGHSHGFLPGLMKKIGRFGSHELKGADEEHHHHPHHHRHGTRDKELFGFEDAERNHREHKDLFGSSDIDNPRNIEKADSLFGYEDKKFEVGEKGRDLVGNDDPNTLSNRDRMNILGSGEGDEGETRHVFGEENTEDSDEEDVGSEEYEKDVHHDRSH